MTAMFRATVQASSDVAGRGTVAVVLVRDGMVAVGDRLACAGGSALAEVTAVEVFAADPEDEPGPPQLGLLLSGLTRADLPCGCELQAVDSVSHTPGPL